MMEKILGTILVILGGLILTFPQFARRLGSRKLIRKLRKLYFALALSIGIFFIYLGLFQRGIVYKIIGLLGLIGIIKSYFFVSLKSTEYISNLAEKIPLYVFRIGGIFYILLGLVLLNK